jgi:uncharacterized coiled-coil protein SlyX
MFNDDLKSRIRQLEAQVSEQKYLIMSIAHACVLEYHCKQSHDAYYSKPKVNEAISK